MTDIHPVQVLRERLEDARTRAIEVLAARETFQVDDLRDLATIQGALQAVRQTIGDHAGGLGWAGDEEELEKAALDIRKAGAAG